MGIVMHPFLLRVPVEKYSHLKKGMALQNYTFSFYFHGIECLSGLIYWIIYVYSKNLIRRFIILFCHKREEEYLYAFIEEKKLYEENSVEILNTTENTISRMSIASSAWNDNIKMQENKEAFSFYTNDETL